MPYPPIFVQWVENLSEKSDWTEASLLIWLISLFKYVKLAIEIFKTWSLRLTTSLWCVNVIEWHVQVWWTVNFMNRYRVRFLIDVSLPQLDRRLFPLEIEPRRKPRPKLNKSSDSYVEFVRVAWNSAEPIENRRFFVESKKKVRNFFVFRRFERKPIEFRLFGEFQSVRDRWKWKDSDFWINFLVEKKFDNFAK